MFSRILPKLLFLMVLVVSANAAAVNDSATAVTIPIAHIRRIVASSACTPAGRPTGKAAPFDLHPDNRTSEQPGRLQ